MPASECSKVQNSIRTRCLCTWQGRLRTLIDGLHAQDNRPREQAFITRAMTHVPYRGAAPAMTDLLGGQVQVMFIGLPPSIEHIRSGRLRALAVTTAMRFEALPDLPPAGDFVPGYEASQWWALGLRKSTPGAIVERLNKEINAILAEPQVQARLSDLGSAMFAGSSADFETFIVNETEKWSKVIRAANIKPE